MRAGRYLSKAETLAVLLHGGVKESVLLTLPHVRREDIETARGLLRRAFREFDREMEEYVESVKRQREKGRQKAQEEA